jgi:hypothetical protein
MMKRGPSIYLFLRGVVGWKHYTATKGREKKEREEEKEYKGRKKENLYTLK